MSSELQVNAFPREELGKGQTRAVCREKNMVPAVVYGKGKKNANIYLGTKEANMLLDNPAFHQDVMILMLNGKKQKVKMQDFQVHPSKGTVRHVDFIRA